MKTYCKVLIVLGLGQTFFASTALAIPERVMVVRQLFYCVNPSAKPYLLGQHDLDKAAKILSYELASNEVSTSIQSDLRGDHEMVKMVIRQPFTASNIVTSGETVCALLTKD